MKLPVSSVDIEFYDWLGIAVDNAADRVQPLSKMTML